MISRSKFFPLRVDPISKNSLIPRSKMEFMQINISLFSEKSQGAFIRAQVFIRINTVGLNKYCQCRIYTVWHSIYICLRHYCTGKLNCSIFRTNTVIWYSRCPNILQFLWYKTFFCTTINSNASVTNQL